MEGNRTRIARMTRMRADITVKIRAIRVIRVPRRDGGADSYAVAGIAELCDLCGDLDANISSSCIS
jgi:hypothetical protein